MKGRCVVPKNGLGLQDDGRVFKDLGCIVKNRKGKRRPGRVRADVTIESLYFGKILRTDGRYEWSTFGGRPKVCTNARRCSSKKFSFPISAESGIKVVGALNCIKGSKGISADPYAFVSRVGELPSARSEGPGGLLWGHVMSNFRSSCE